MITRGAFSVIGQAPDLFIFRWTMTFCEEVKKEKEEKDLSCAKEFFLLLFIIILNKGK